MKKLNLLISFFLLLSNFVEAESDLNAKVVLCDSYDDFGAPTGINKNWVINETGGNVYILYSQDKNINTEITLSVSKKNSSGTYAYFDNQSFSYNPVKEKKKWAVFDYEFKEEGDYKISVLNTGSKELASTFTNITITKESASEVNMKKSGLETDGDKADANYYKNSQITFGESVDENAVVSGAASVFNLVKGKKDIMVKLYQDNDLNATMVKVDVYGGLDYKDKISSENFNIGSKTWNWIKVPLSFNKPGKYVVDMYNEDDIFINSAYLEIKEIK